MNKNLDKYPRLKKFMQEHPKMTFDEVYEYVEKIDNMSHEELVQLAKTNGWL